MNRSLENHNVPMDDLPLGIRAATIMDLAALVEMESAAFQGDRFNRRQFRYLLTRAQASVLVATEPDAPVAGYVILLYRAGQPSARVYSLAVSPACRRRGIGRRLLTAGAQVAAGRGATALHLEVRVDNTAGIDLYSALGYHEVSRREHYYDDGATAICMRCSLRHSTEG